MLFAGFSYKCHELPVASIQASNSIVHILCTVIFFVLCSLAMCSGAEYSSPLHKCATWHHRKLTARLPTGLVSTISETAETVSPCPTSGVCLTSCPIRSSDALFAFGEYPGPHILSCSLKKLSYCPA